MVASGVRAILAGLAAAALLFSLAGPVLSDATDTDAAQTPTMVTFAFEGGTITMNPDLVTGPRFLTKVPPPVFTRTEEALQNPRLQPGDGGDQGPIVLERRHTDYSYMYEDWTGGMRIRGIHGSASEYICVCDAVFVMSNYEGLDPTRPVRAIDSSRLWFDNLTIYGGGIGVWDTNDVIISNSLFIDSGGVEGFNADRGYVHNVSVVNQRPITNLLHYPPEAIGGDELMCFPHNIPPCEGSGVFPDGHGWIVEWSYFQGTGGVGGPTAKSITIRHNTFRDSIVQWGAGTSKIAWNLFRGNHDFGPNAYPQTNLLYHNNSIILPFKVDHGTGVKANAGLFLQDCALCMIRDNDFMGYGTPHPVNPQCCAALRVNPWVSATIIANGNYWGTIHDPKLPPGFWIQNVKPDRTELVLDEWEVAPIHDITPLMYTLDHRDVPWWIEQLTGLPTYPLFQDLPAP